MDFSLNEEQRMWQMKARKFADEEIRSMSLERDWIADPRATFDWEIVKKGSKLGFRTAALARKWGGHGIDLVTQVIVMAELAKADSAISKTFSQCWKWSQLIDAICTEEQKKRFLPPFVADDTCLLGSGSTEPNSGSDNRLPPEDDPKAGIRLRAERKGDEWILNGEKCFIANGGVGKLFFVRTRTDPNVSAKKGTTLFLVPSDTPGFRIGKVFDKSGWRFYQNAELIFENARVPHANLVGEVNAGADARGGDASNFSDLELAGNAVGVCEAAVERAMQCAQARRRAGKYLRDHQAVLLKLSEMHVLTEALRSFVLRTAWERDQAVRGDKTLRKSPNASFAMIFAQTTIQRVTELNMEISAAAGGMDAYADKLVRDGIIWTHLAGASVQRIKAVKGLLK
ncbi:MAG TPA: acyl-CoA dehydrogenase family protein [Burkholderiales bacterium]|nr:acyl-CoA dehydrogenase family protein [Burkholderiales bacterium]